jgi:hypothetical protein
MSDFIASRRLMPSKRGAALIGPWLISSGRAIIEDRLTVARAAVIAPFMVDPAEVLYLGALRDSEGNTLQSSHEYTVARAGAHRRPAIGPGVDCRGHGKRNQVIEAVARI